MITSDIRLYCVRLILGVLRCSDRLSDDARVTHLTLLEHMCYTSIYSSVMSCEAVLGRQVVCHIPLNSRRVTPRLPLRSRLCRDSP
jgi:hypothetical protein